MHRLHNSLSCFPQKKNMRTTSCTGTKLTAAQSLLFEFPRPEFEFYDLLNDPFELNNLIDDIEYDDEVNRLKSVLEEWRQTTDDFPPTERRRQDNVDRFTGVKFDMTRLPPRIE